MRSWFSQHLYSLRGAFARWRQAPVGTLFSVVVLGVALSLPVGLFVLLDNVQGVSRRLPSEPELSVYLNVEVDAQGAAAIETRLKQSSRVRGYKFISRDTALEQLKESSGMPDLIDTLP